MPWIDFLKLFNQGNKPYPQDVKKEVAKTEVKKEEIVFTLKDDTTTKNGPNQRINIKDTTEKKLQTFSNNGRLTLMGGVANPTSERDNILLLDWCCSDSSFFGMPSVDSKGCTVTRLTMREDMTTDYGYRYAQSAVNNAPRNNTIFLWCAIPCTGGSP